MSVGKVVRAPFFLAPEQHWLVALRMPCFAVKTWIASATHLLPHLLLVLPDWEKPF